MRKIKKALALLLSAAMVLGMGSMAFAAPETKAEETAYDKPLTVSGLEKDDVAHFYQVIEWVGEAEGNVTGWKATEKFAGVLTEDKLKEILVGTEQVPPAGISAELAGELARAAKEATAVEDVTVTGTTAVLENAASGMYMAIVTPKDPDVVYNPIFVFLSFSSYTLDSFKLLSSHGTICFLLLFPSQRVGRSCPAGSRLMSGRCRTH